VTKSFTTLLLGKSGMISVNGGPPIRHAGQRLLWTPDVFGQTVPDLNSDRHSPMCGKRNFNNVVHDIVSSSTRMWQISELVPEVHQAPGSAHSIPFKM
jgi:hypothetical protein